jgi:hypothetical protein
MREHDFTRADRILQDQIKVKDTQIAALLDRDKENKFSRQRIVHSHKRFMARSPILSLLRLLRACSVKLCN